MRINQVLVAQNFYFKCVDICSAPENIKSFIKHLSIGKNEIFLLKRIDPTYLEVNYGGPYKADKLPPYAILVGGIILYYPKNNIPYKVTFHPSGMHSDGSIMYVNTFDKLFFDNQRNEYYIDHELSSLEDLFDKLQPEQKEFVIKNPHLFGG